MKLTTTDGGGDSGDGRGPADLRDYRSFFENSGGFIRCGHPASGSGFIGPAGRRLQALFSGVAGPPCIDGGMLFERCLLKGRRHRRFGRCGRVGADIGGARALVSIVVRMDLWAFQPKSKSVGGQGSERRRRGRLGGEVAVSNQHKVKAGRGLGRVVSSSLLVGGSAMAPGSAQDSLSNNRLKQTARGRSGAESLRRTRAAA